MGARFRAFGGWLVVGVVAGCGGDPAAPTTPSGSTTTVTPSVTPPVTPPVPSPTEPATTTTPPATTTPDTSSSPTTSEPPVSSETGADLSSDVGSDSSGTVGYVDEGKREFLSQTGLYADVASETLGPRVKEFKPQFGLWTDGADKRRWVHIPEGAQIDTTYTDEWQFPVGTKIWKEFSRDGVRIETRLIEKLPPERASEGFQGWYYMTYVWNDDLTEAVATEDGVENAKGTDHDVPAVELCGDCHDMRREKPIGFSALQLSHADTPTTLDMLLAEGWISKLPDAPLVVPGTPEQQQMLGYFHANCGHCHREGSPTNNRVATLKLWMESTAITSFEQSDAVLSLVGQYTQSAHGSKLMYRVVPGDPDNSELMRRLLFREVGDIAGEPVVDENGEPIEVPMPPLGTEVVDDPAVERVRAWIAGLPVPAQ